MCSKRESPTKMDVARDGQIKIKPKLSTLPQSGMESKEMLNASFSSLLKHLEPFSPSCRDARLDEKITPLKSQIFSSKTQLTPARMPLDSLTNNVTMQERIRTPHRSLSIGRDDFWEALRSHYNYLMDEGLIATCREASDELSWEDEGVNQECCWSFTEFIQKFNELHDALHNLQSDVVAASELVPSQTNAEIRKAVFEKLQLVVFGCKSFKEQAQQLGRRYPDMKDEINRRVNLLANKWEAVEQAINPHKPSVPKEEGVFQEIAQEMRCLRRWLRELESRLHPLTICPTWTLDELEEKYKDQQVLQKEIESRGKFVSSLLKLCDRLGEGEVVGLIGQGHQVKPGAAGGRDHGTEAERTDVKGGDRNEPNRPDLNQQQLQSWDAERIRRLASNLEKRWHAIWLRSLEWQCLVEELIQKYRSGNRTSNSPLDFSFGDEPVHKYPRLSGELDPTRLAVRPKMTDPSQGSPDLLDPSLAITPSPTFSSSPDLVDQDCDVVRQNHGSLTTDRGVMVGTTGIAQLKAECGGSFGRFEIIQDVGYSSESSTQLSNDERSEFIRVYSYNPADHGRTTVTEYKLSEETQLGKPALDIKRDQHFDTIPNVMEWQFTSEDDDYEKHSEYLESGSPIRGHQPLNSSSPVRKRELFLPLKSVLEDSDLSDDEEWLKRHSGLEVSGVTLVAGSDAEDAVLETVRELLDDHVISNEVKKLVVKADQMVREESRKRAADSTTQIAGDKHLNQILFGKAGIKSTLKGSRVKAWLRDCHPTTDEVVSGVDSTVEEDGLEEWPRVVSARKNLEKPVGVVVDSSCDASGEYTTNDSDCDGSSSADESQSQGDEVNESIALSRSGTGSVETVVPLGRIEDNNAGSKGAEGIVTSTPRVVLRSKKRGSRYGGDRPWSVTELHQLTSQLIASPFSTSEGALNTLIHSSSSSSVRTKLLRGSSLPKYRKSSQSSIPLVSSSSSSHLPHPSGSSSTLPLRKTRRNRSRGSLHVSPTSPTAPSSVGGLPSKTSGQTPPGTSTATTTDSSSEGPSPASAARSIPQSLSGSDSAQLSGGGGVTSTSSLPHSGSSGSKSSTRRRRSPPSKTNPRKKSSPLASVIGLEQVKEIPAIKSELELTTAPVSLAPTEDQSSVSDQVWDGYEDAPYWSEPYSEQTADEDQVKRLLNFGDDYRAFIGSHSDTSSSAGGFRAPNSEGSILPLFRGRTGTVTSQDYQDESDSDSDVEELQHVMGESLRALQFAQSTLCQHKNAPPPSESVELLATCQTNLKCLQVIAEHLDTGVGLRNLTSDDLAHLQSLISGWEMLQSSVLTSQANGQQYKDVQLEIADLRDKMSELALVAGATCKPFTDVEKLEKRIATLQASLSTLHETKATLLAVNLKVHRLLTDAGLTLSGLKDDVTDLYRRWDDVYEQSGAKLSELQEAHGTWQRFHLNRQKLFDLLTREERPDQREEDNDATSDPYRKLAERSSRAKESQELVIGLHQDSKYLEPYLGTSGPLWSKISEDLRELGHRVNRLQQDVALACRRQSVVETSFDLGTQIVTQSFDSSSSSNVTVRHSKRELSEERSKGSPDIPSARVAPQKQQVLQDVLATPKNIAVVADKSSVRVPDRRPRRSRFWRVVRAAMPIQMALVLLYCLAWLLEPHCCDVLNNMNFSFTPTLRYTRGPPPV